MGLMDFKPALPEELEKERAEEELGITEESLPPLVSRILSDFEKAKRAKQSVHERLISCLRLFMSKYSVKEESEIEESGQPNVFIPLTNIKCRAGKAWLNDIYFEPGKSLFEVKPTPVPTLPEEKEQKVLQRLQNEVSDIVQKAVLLSEATNGEFNLQTILDKLNERGEEIREEYEKRIRDEAAKACERVKRELHDQFVEGGFYDAFRQVLQDIVVYPTAVLKGPVKRKVKRYFSSSEVVEEEIPTFNRVSPFDAFPAPNAKSFDSGFFIEILHLSDKDLNALIGIDGFFEDEIRECLIVYQNGFRLTPQGEQQQQITDEHSYTSYYESKTFDILEYWGTLPGYLLKEWGMEKIEDDEFYDICAWVLDRRIIGVILNPDPLGKKPYTKASFVEIPDSFWGISLPEILEPLQKAVNSLSRAIISNAVYSSGPLIEVNEDRVGRISELYPFMIVHAKESALNSAPAVRHYQTRETAVAIAQVLALYQKMADEYSGIPAYAHGDITVGGAGRTAAGLAMLQSHMTRGIKDIVMNLDRGIVEQVVKRLYYQNLREGEFGEDIPDLVIEARGIMNYSEREAQANRLLEFLRITSSSPIDTQITGVEGRKYLLENIARKLGIDVEKVFPSEIEEVKQMLQALQQQAQPVPAPNQTGGIVEMAQQARKGVME